MPKTAILNVRRSRGKRQLQRHPRSSSSDSKQHRSEPAATSPRATLRESPLYIMPLTGSDLLAKDKELGDASKSDLVRAAGYLSTKKDGSERLNFTAL
jgi:hypothetical protein